MICSAASRIRRRLSGVAERGRRRGCGTCLSYHANERESEANVLTLVYNVGMGELDGKVAVITGAGSGMARATAKVFVREGARVLGVDISGREKETADELGDAFVPFHGDVSRESDVEAMFAAALDAFGKVDVVCNVAG